MARRTLVLLPVAAALAYMLVPGIGSTRDSLIVYNVVAGATLVALGLAFLVCRPLPAGPWTLVGVALVGWVAGDLVFTAVGSDPTVSVADLLYIPGYLGFILAAAWLVRSRTHERDLDSMIDALLVGITGLLFLWILVIEPTWNAPGASSTGQLMSALYPLLDVVLLFFLVRLLLSPGRTASVVVFVAAVAAMLIADSAYAALQQTDSYAEGLVRMLDGFWLLGYACIPVAVVLNRNDALPVAPVPHGSTSRLAGLLAAGIALVALPAADIAARSTGRPLTNAVLAIVGAAIVVLVFTRIIRLHASLDHALAQVERQQRYYRAVANHSSDAFVVLDADGRVIDASGALEAILGHDVATAQGVDAMTVVHPEDRRLARALLDDVRSTTATVTVTGEIRVVTAAGSVIWMELHCTNLGDDPAVGGIVVNAHDVTSRKDAEAALEHRALHDGLTGLANRALLKDRIEHALARRARDGSDVAVLFLDLDGFKLINDGVGHEAGDEVLRVAGQRLAVSLRPEDTVARIGGDEFAALVEGDGNLATEVHAIAQRLLASIEAPVVVQGTPMVVTTSIGVAVASEGGQTTPDELLRDADTAMYSAKARGRNRAVPYDATMRTAVLTKVQLGTDLRRAVAQDQLHLLYQPIVELRSSTITGFEALLRWDHPSRGLLTPDEFITIAEDNGTIIEVGRWAMRAACRAAQAWPDTAHGHRPQISVNVSGRQLVRSDFVAQVSDAIVETGIPAGSLILELTESALVEHADAAEARLRALEALGVRVAIDDFGVGQSSLGYLRQFPVDILKLDRSFVAMITGSNRVPALIGGLLELARTLDLQALAEGIETRAQRIALRDEGCDLGQGFLFSRPVDHDAAGRMLAVPTAPRRGAHAPA